MYDRELYEQILGIAAPWEVTGVEVDRAEMTVRIRVEWKPTQPLSCLECGEQASQYDRRERSWRHLDTCQYKTIVSALVPRVECQKHGVQQVTVPWAERGSRLTMLFERLAIDWLKEASIKAVAEQLRLSWDEVDGIMKRAVERGLARRERQAPQRLGIDETSFQKRHEYVTVMTDLEESRVVAVLDDRKQETLEKALLELGQRTLAKMETIALDMWQPYIAAIGKVVPDAEGKIAFDRFHVAKHLGEAVDQVRRREHRAFMSADGESPLTRTKYVWLSGKERLDLDQSKVLAEASRSARKTGRAWELKELARNLWCYSCRGWAKRAWLEWYSRAIRSRLEPVKKKARMIKAHLDGIVNAVVSGVTNATAEAINSRIQWIKKLACGFRNRARFRNAILFHLGGLDLYPRPILSA